MQEVDQLKQRLLIQKDSVIVHFSKKWRRVHESNQVRIAVMGEFSSGKTSFLEHLFGGVKLGTKLSEATALPVLYTYGEPSIYGKWHNKPMAIRLLAEDLSSHTMNTELPYDYLEVTLKIDYLKEIEFWDTPGSNGTIQSELPQGSIDALFWCLPYNEPLSKTQRERLNRFRIAPIFLILTKADLMDEAEEDERYLDKIDRLKEVIALEAAYTSRIDEELDELSTTKLYEWIQRTEVLKRKRERLAEERKQANEELIYALESISKKKQEYVDLYQQALSVLKKAH